MKCLLLLLLLLLLPHWMAMFMIMEGVHIVPISQHSNHPQYHHIDETKPPD
jgi:hypothetical protein